MRRGGQGLRGARPNPYEDVQVELTLLCFHRLLPTVVVGGITSVGASSVLAVYYQDPWFWTLTAIVTFLSAIRVATVIRFPANEGATMTAATALRWEKLYSYVTVVYIVGATLVTVSTVHRHDSIGLGICMLGTFAYANAIGARLSIPPWVAKLVGSIMLVGLAIPLLGSPQLITRCSVCLLGVYAYIYFEAIDVKYDVLVEQLRLKRKMSDLAGNDVLTGLANRREFCVRLTKACHEPAPFALLYMDLDGFKKVNDGLGHAAGDALLQQVALRLKTAVPGALVARLGGDEFALLHRLEGGLSVEVAAARINEVIAAPFPIAGHSVKVGTSIGIQMSGPEQSDPDTLLSKADAALYHVKRGGGGGFRFAEDSVAVPKIEAAVEAPTECAQASGRGQNSGNRFGEFLVGIGQ